jgi:hypothetical protein
MAVSEPASRLYKGCTVYGWKSVFDEQAMRRRLEEMMPTNMPPAQREAMVGTQVQSMRAAVGLWCGGYESAAVAQNLALGVGTPRMIEQAVDSVRTETAASVEAVRIYHTLGSRPCLMCWAGFRWTAFCGSVSPFSPLCFAEGGALPRRRARGVLFAVGARTAGRVQTFRPVSRSGR